MNVYMTIGDGYSLTAAEPSPSGDHQKGDVLCREYASKRSCIAFAKRKGYTII